MRFGERETPIASASGKAESVRLVPQMVRQLRALEKENARLKKLVADQTLDMSILKEAAKGNW